MIATLKKKEAKKPMKKFELFVQVPLGAIFKRSFRLWPVYGVFLVATIYLVPSLGRRDIYDTDNASPPRWIRY